MDSSVTYGPSPSHHHAGPSHHHHGPSSFGIDNILTGINTTTPTQLQSHNHYGNGCDMTSLPSMILRKIDNSTERKRESVSSADDDDDSFRKKKKPRTAFSREQVGELEKKFTEKKYLSSAERGELAEKLKLSDMQVKTWFQNRRMKYKRQTEENEMELKSPKYPYSSFVPYTSLYGYVPPPYKGDHYGNGGGTTGYSPGGSSCSQQYSPSDSYTSCYPATPTMSPAHRYSPSHQHRSINGGVFFNRVSPLSSPSTPAASSYSTSYFTGDFNATFPHNHRHNSTNIPNKYLPLQNTIVID